MTTHRIAGTRPAAWLVCLLAVLSAHGVMLLLIGARPPVATPPTPQADPVLLVDLPPPAPMPTVPVPTVPVITPFATLPTPPRAVATPPPRPRPLIRAKPSKPAIIRKSEDAAALPSLPPSPSQQQHTTPTPVSPNPVRVSSWQAELVRRLQQAQHYPDSARDRGERGTASVTFTMDRTGLVQSVLLARSSGSALLDTEAIATVRRASPLPPPPDGFGGSVLTFTLPLRFTIGGT